MGLEINIRVVINLALPLVCLCPQGQGSPRVDSQCCLAHNKDRRDLLDGYVPESTKNFERHKNGGLAKRFMRRQSVLEYVEKTTTEILHKMNLKRMFIQQPGQDGPAVLKETNDVFSCASK